jgi:4-alpha-glucanotransferase
MISLTPAPDRGRGERSELELPYGCGVLLHITSLPSPYGMGDLGPEAYEFADLLHRTGVKVWQILPLNPTSLASGNSPYYSNSCFASNTLLISPELLFREGLLERGDMNPAPCFPEGEVDFASVVPFREHMLDLAAARFDDRGDLEGFRDFCTTNLSWLEDHALFTALKERFPGISWNRWPAGLRDRQAGVLARCRQRLSGRVTREKILQYLFSRQWSDLKAYCNEKGILVMGDLPLYMTHDSVDVWANPGLFDLDSGGDPRAVAGVPPDYFSRDGQLWGNPLYRWEAHEAQGFDWWLARMAQAAGRFDLVRIDHFRGFSAYWEVDAGEKTAASGRWVPGPGRDLFSRLFRSIPGMPLIAEDLGFITPDVRELMAEFRIPGMRVLLFGFDGDPARNPNHPGNVPERCILYTGTHDNNTVRGWFEYDATSEEKERLFAFLGRTIHPDEVSRVFTAMALDTRASLVVLPLQDILGLGEQGRMNTPGTTAGNWNWRVQGSQLDPELGEYLSGTIADHHRR